MDSKDLSDKLAEAEKQAVSTLTVALDRLKRGIEQDPHIEGAAVAVKAAAYALKALRSVSIDSDLRY